MAQQINHRTKKTTNLGIWEEIKAPRDRRTRKNGDWKGGIGEGFYQEVGTRRRALLLV